MLASLTSAWNTCEPSSFWFISAFSFVWSFSSLNNAGFHPSLQYWRPMVCQRICDAIIWGKLKHSNLLSECLKSVVYDGQPCCWSLRFRSIPTALGCRGANWSKNGVPFRLQLENGSGPRQVICESLAPNSIDEQNIGELHVDRVAHFSFFILLTRY